MKLSEADVTRQVKDYLEHRGWRAIRMNRGLMNNGSNLVQFGEPGMPDYLFLRYWGYRDGSAVALWVEFKAQGKASKCRCATKKSRQRCTACDQLNWRITETYRDAQVWLVDDLQAFWDRYNETFGWLHTGDTGRGQLEMSLTGK